MGLLDNIFGIFKKQKEYTYAEVLNGSRPVFTSFGRNIYASDVVQQSIYTIVTELKKLKPMHVKGADTNMKPVSGEIQRLLDRPNPLMTRSDFIEKITWMLLLNYNSFVVPVYDIVKNKETGQTRKRYRALYPVNPSKVTFLQDEAGNYYVELQFRTGFTMTVPYNELIHIKSHYSVNPFMGGNEQGVPDQKALLETLQINKDMLTNISHAMKSSYAINGVVKYKTMSDTGKMMKDLKDFEQKILESGSGILPLDFKFDYIPITKDVKLVDEATLKFIDSKVLRAYKVPLKILTGEFTKEEYEAFYQATLEPYVVSLSDEFTRVLFTDREKDHENNIKFFPKELIFLSTEQTIKMIEILSPTGALMENEKRVALGLPPLPELEGKRYMSLNWINGKDASKYQVGDKGDKKDE